MKNHSIEEEEKIVQHMPGEDEIAGVSEALKQLGDPSRLRIFWLLCHCEEYRIHREHEQPGGLPSPPAPKKQRPHRKPQGGKRDVL